MAILSKSKLIPILVSNGFIESEKSVGYEAYGKKVFAYVRLKSAEERAKLEAFLSSRGISYNAGYWPGSSIAEVRVSYFKALHWDE